VITSLPSHGLPMLCLAVALHDQHSHKSHHLNPAHQVEQPLTLLQTCSVSQQGHVHPHSCYMGAGYELKTSLA
jgi:hypothetical protein